MTSAPTLHRQFVHVAGRPDPSPSTRPNWRIRGSHGSTNTGPTDENSYIRIDGPSVWIEFVNARSQSTPNIHYHSVCRDKTNDYGSSKPS